VNLTVRIVIVDELTESVVRSSGMLDLASGEIRNVEYDAGYDPATHGIPAADADYEFTSGLLSHAGKEVEFRIEADPMSGQYSITPSELLELKNRAARLFGEAP
jgi:hypothetical protein